ncbi:MAG: exo-alpha-sialidase [Sedimentisphaeraceae bacterium JB056]
MSYWVRYIYIFLFVFSCYADDSAGFRAARIITDIGDEHCSENRSFQGIPSIEIADNGRLWATWFGGGFGETDENYVILATSSDGGVSWSKEKLVVDFPVPDYPSKLRAFDPSLWVDPNGKLWVFWAQSYGWYDGRAGVWAITTDQPQKEEPVWSKPKRLCDGIMINKPLILSDGQWAMPVAQWSPKVKKQFIYHPDVPKDRYLSNMFVSSDEGQSWQWRGGADVAERGHDENTIIERKDGSLWMLIRTKYGYGESYSYDMGKTWTEGQKAGFENPTARIFIGRLISGRLLLIKNGPVNKRTERITMVAFLSDNDGESWYGGLVIDERDEVSYPNAAQADDGIIYAIYDRSRYEAKEILAARFTEQDVAGGECVSDVASLKNIVNKSSGEPAHIAISPDGGVFENQIQVKLSYPIYGPWIYYTLDGTTPDRDSTHYTKPIIIDSDTIIKAKAIGGAGGQHQSPVSVSEFEVSD